MRVKELIEKLQDYDEDLPVMIRRVKRSSNGQYRPLKDMKKSQTRGFYFLGIDFGDFKK